MKISAGPQLQYAGTLASLKQKLDAGDVPQDLVLLKGGQEVPLHPETARKAGRGQHLSRALPLAAATAMGGAVFGMLAGGSLTPALHYSTPIMLPLAVGMGAGAVLGAAVGLVWGGDLRGQVKVELDGRTERKAWKGEAQLHERSAEEVKVMLTALGQLGEGIAPARVELVGAPDAQVKQSLRQHKDRLVELDEQRRLVADLGQHSNYGLKALQLVDAGAAVELASRGRPVFVVNGQSPTDQPHHLRTTAYTRTKNEVVVDDYQYVDRKFDYTLTPLARLEQAEPKACGLPEGLVGVYRDTNSYVQSVERRSEQGQRVFLDKGEERKRHSLEKASLVSQSKTQKSGVPEVLSNLTRQSTKASTITGSLLGGCAAGLLGVDPTAGLIAGGLVGHLAGRAAISADEDSSLPKVMRAVMMTAGAAVGVGMALQGGLHANLAVGAVGGMLTGLYAGVRWSPDNSKLIGQGAFMGGTVLAMAATVAGGSPYTTIPLALLGAAGGAVLGRIAIR